MWNTICICCAGRMTVPCPRNPNICLSCEQLLDDDCAALEQLMAEPEPAATVARPNTEVERREMVAVNS